MFARFEDFLGEFHVQFMLQRGDFILQFFLDIDHRVARLPTVVIIQEARPTGR